MIRTVKDLDNHNDNSPLAAAAGVLTPPRGICEGVLRIHGHRARDIMPLPDAEPTLAPQLVQKSILDYAIDAMLMGQTLGLMKGALDGLGRLSEQSRYRVIEALADELVLIVDQWQKQKGKEKSSC